MAIETFNNDVDTKNSKQLKNGDLTKENFRTEQRNSESTCTMSSSQAEKSIRAKVSVKKSPARVSKAVAIPPDGGWGWVITFSSFMVSFVLDGMCFTFGFFFADFQSYFGTNNSTTSFISSCLNGSYMITGPVASALVNIFGCRKVAFFGAVMTSLSFFLSTFSPNVEVMILLYGVCGGIGFGLMYLPAIVMVGYYFDKRRALATGIAVCGSGVGGFLFAPLSEVLLQKYHWKGALWIISAICLNGVVFASLLRPLEANDSNAAGIKNLPENKLAETKEDFVKSIPSSNRSVSDEIRSDWSLQNIRHLFSDIFDLSLLKSITFVIYSTSCFLCMMGFYVPFIYIPAVAQEQGIASSEITWIISTIGIVNTAGRVGVGYISDKSWCDVILVNVVSLVIGGTATLFVPFYTVYPVLILYGVVFGFSIAAFVSLRSIIIVDLLGIDKLTNSFGIVVLCQGLSTFIGSPIAGALSDATGNYIASFYLAGTALILSGVICLPLRRLNRWEKERVQRKNVQQISGNNKENHVEGTRTILYENPP